MRNILGQTKSAFNLRDIMDQKKILIVNLSKGKVGELNSRLLGMIFVIKFQAAAMSRASVPEEQRTDFGLYVDEFQNFSTDSFASILSEARKYRLNLIVANQFIGQLSDEIRDAVFGNIGTMISYRCGPEDAEFLVKQFAPVFDASDLVNLPNFNSIVKLLIGGLPSQPFSMQGLPFLANSNPELGAAIKQLSAAKFGRPRAEAEADIFSRLSNDATVSKPAAPSPLNPPPAPAPATVEPSQSAADNKVEDTMNDNQIQNNPSNPAAGATAGLDAAQTTPPASQPSPAPPPAPAPAAQPSDDAPSIADIVKAPVVKPAEEIAQTPAASPQVPPAQLPPSEIVRDTARERVEVLPSPQGGGAAVASPETPPVFESHHKVVQPPPEVKVEVSAADLADAATTPGSSSAPALEQTMEELAEVPFIHLNPNFAPAENTPADVQPAAAPPTASQPAIPPAPLSEPASAPTPPPATTIQPSATSAPETTPSTDTPTPTAAPAPELTATAPGPIVEPNQPAAPAVAPGEVDVDEHGNIIQG